MTTIEDRQNTADNQPEETARTEAVVEAYRLGYDAGKGDGSADGPRMIEKYDYCPRWCASREDDREDHGDDHQSVPVGAYPAVGTTKEGWPSTLTADLAQRFMHGRVDREEYLRHRHAVVELVLGDEVIVRLLPSAARSLAAGLVHLADLEEGLTRTAAPQAAESA